MVGWLLLFVAMLTCRLLFSMFVGVAYCLFFLVGCSLLFCDVLLGDVCCCLCVGDIRGCVLLVSCLVLVVGRCCVLFVMCRYRV